MRPFPWRDSALTFALGLSLLTVLVIPHWNWLVLARHRSYTIELSSALSKGGFLLLGSASLGMFVGGLIAYLATRNERGKFARSVLTAFWTALIAFPLTASIILLIGALVSRGSGGSVSSYAVVLVLTGGFGILLYGVPCLVVTALWSLLYMAQIASSSEPLEKA